MDSHFRGDDFELKFFEGIAKRSPDYIDALIPLAEIYTRRGLYKQGLKIDLRIVELLREDPVAHYNLACSYALVGKSEEAVQALMLSIQLGYDDIEHMAQDPDLKSLHKHPAYLQLIKSV